MQNHNTQMECPTCGLTDRLDEFDPHPDNTGVWCPDCQTFIWHDPADNHQRSTLLLEQKTSPATAGEPHPASPYKFNKRLSPLRYPGGKSKLIDYLFTRLQKDKCETFVEVFAGGASFGLALLDAGVVNHLVLNDADKNLITFWKEVFYNPEPLIQKLHKIHPTHQDYSHAKGLLCTSAPASPPELAWAYLLVNRLNYSGIQKAGCLGGKHGSTDALLARYNPKALIKQITHLAELKDCITILGQDYTDCIQKYYWNDRATLFIDPPYYAQGKALYNNYFTDQDHRDLADLIQSLTLEFPGCADILITYDNDPFIQSLYWSINPIYINRKYSI